MTDITSHSYVRTDEAPTLPPPPGTVGVQGWLRQNLFSSIGNSILTVAIGLLLFVIGWSIIDWAIITAVWTGEDRTNCAVEGAGACWPFVWAKFPQWLYGFYPIDQRWRPTLVFIIGAVALVPMLMPSVPFKQWNALFLIVIFPVIALILLSGGNFNFSLATYGGIIALGLLATVLIPVINGGIESGIQENKFGVVLALIGVAPAILWLIAEAIAALAGFLGVLGKISLPGRWSWVTLDPVFGTLAIPFNWAAYRLDYVRDQVNDIPYLPYIVFGAFSLAAVATLASLVLRGGTRIWGSILGWLGLLVAVLGVFVVLDIDFGLSPVETSSWGGLLVTLVVSVTGIAASLPLGILLALGRRSKMPAVRLISIVFIEVWRGVPLITVLFMSSVMLPLFLPEGLTFDKLLRALIGISLFSAAYMAEVVRGGLQAIGKGQYEGAQALGLSYWQMMRKIILPQALKISIPNIVGNFIGLFKDTTLVLIIGIYDFLGIITAGTQDAKWASPQTGNTGYFAAAVIYCAFCFGMSRYAMYTERRLNTGHKR